MRQRTDKSFRNSYSTAMGTSGLGLDRLYIQSLEFIAETRILAEMKIKNGGKKSVPWKKNRQAYFFFCENLDDRSVKAI